MKFVDLIFEGREDDFKVTYGEKFSPEKLDAIINIANEVPGGSKFLTFLGRVLPNTVSDGILQDTVKPVLKKFVAIGSNLEVKDINQYKTFAELNTAIQKYENRIRREVQTIEGADLVYEDNKFTVVAPLTTQASCYYGAGTKWCTASSADNTHFKNYMDDGKLFYFIDKTKPTSDKFYKVAMLKKFEGDVSFFDAPDQKFTKGWILDTKEFEKINQAITSYMNSKYAEQIELYKDKEKVRLEKARIERERRQAQINEKLETANVRREDDEWNPEILDSGDLGSCAWALYTHLVNEGEITPKTPESTQRLEEAKVELEQLQETYANIENANEITDLVSDIESLEEEIRELESRKDVYNIIPLGYQHYDLYVLTTSDFDKEWYVGDSAKTERSAIESVRNLLDDVGIEGFNPSFVMGHFDDDKFRDYLREFFEEDVYNNPEAYLEDSDRNLSRGQEARITELKQEISQLNDELNNLDDEDEDYDSEYERIENEIQEKNDEIEEIESDPDGDYDDDKLESVVDDRVSDYRDDPKIFYDTFFGGGSREFDEWAKEFIDENSLIQDVVDTDGYGHTLNSWDGSQEEVYYNGEGYYLFENGDLSI